MTVREKHGFSQPRFTRKLGFHNNDTDSFSQPRVAFPSRHQISVSNRQLTIQAQSIDMNVGTTRKLKKMLK